MNAETNDVKPPPFRARGRVYSGPQQLALIGAVKRALMSPDSVMTLGGPAGIGKTTSIRHALSRSGSSPVVARIGRVHLAREDVLEVLLDEFDVKQKPTSSLQRFGALKKLLRGWAEAGTSAVVIVEDVERLGVEALVELESLTAADGDDTPGANLVLMGATDLRKFLQNPLLARIEQRLRRNLTLEPFSFDETHGYIEHCLAAADCDIGQVFDDASLKIIHACSGGIARIINNVAETMMLVATDTNGGRVSEALARQVATEDFGFDGDEAINDADAAADAAPSSTGDAKGTVSPPVSKEVPADDIPELIEDTHPPIPAPVPAGSNATPSAVAPSPAETAEQVESRREKTDITQPSLPVLTISDQDAEDRTANIRVEPRAPEKLSKGVTSDTRTIQALDDALRPDTQLLRTLDEPPPEDDDAPVPLGLRDTVDNKPAQPAEADQTATAEVSAASDSTMSNALPEDGEEAPAATANPDQVLEITLDKSLDEQQKALQAKREEEARRLKAAAEERARKEAEKEFESNKEARKEAERKQILESLSARFSEAKSLEDVMDDTAAETLFGEEFSQLAAAVAGMGAPIEEPEQETDPDAGPADLMIDDGDAAADEPVDDEVDAGPEDKAEVPVELELEPDPVAAETKKPAVQADKPKPAANPAPAPAAARPPSAAGALQKAPAKAPPAARPKPPSAGSAKLDTSASQRLKMVRALNEKAGKPRPAPAVPNKFGEEIVLGGSLNSALGGKRKPVPIENQFGEMTASLKAPDTSKARPVVPDHDDDDDRDKGKKKGFLSRFRRS